MTDRYYKKLEEGQEAYVIYLGHDLLVEIYEVQTERVFFRTINPQNLEPRGGNFNRIEAKRYLTVRNKN